MGKLYEAVSKARTRNVEDQFSEPATDNPGHSDITHQFDFMRYSLAARPLLDAQRSKREAAPAVVVRRAVAYPATEIPVDTRGIDPHLVAFHRERKGNEQYNKLAIGLISKAAEGSFKRLLIASANRQEGRTSVALNLACALARARQRVLLVDCDLLNPSVLRLLGARSRIGVEEALAQGQWAGAALARILPYGFDVLPVLRPVENPLEILAAPAFWKTLQMFDEAYNFILFDSPPLLAAGESNLLVRHADSTLLVMRPAATTSSEMAKAIEPFTQDDLFGVVINRAPEK